MVSLKNKIDGQIILSSNPLWINIMVSILITLSMVAGIGLSLMVIKKLNQKAPSGKASTTLYLIPALYGSIFMVMLMAWRWF